MTAPSPAEKAVKEQSLLYRRYRAAKKEQFEELFATPVHGPLLRKFNSTLGHFDIEDADRMVAFVRERTRVWLRAAPQDIRFAALQMVGHRITRIRQRAGLAPFDDPLPGEDPDVYQLCREAIGL
jgi:hypothetical protein